MQKITLAFPDHDSLWQFRNQTQAINVNISPRKNIISGLFGQPDVELATQKFNAVTVNQVSSPASTQKDQTPKQNGLWGYALNYQYSFNKLRKVFNSIQFLKPF